ncbi:MAG: SpoIIE family protein phosphatase [Simkaniaceae bacterium]|nr:SpoIIE family protein phosphatase [Simkaniaceae bacterium]
MTDSSLPGKLPNREEKILKGLGGSLSLRILFVTFMFLVIPLLLLSAMMYWHSYHQKIQDNFFALKVLADEKREKIAAFSQIDRGLLSIVDELLFFEDIENTPLPNPRFDSLFRNLVIEGQNSDVLYVQMRGSQFICGAASDNRLLGQDLSSLFGGRNLEEGEYTFFNAEALSQKDTAFYVAKVVFSRKTGRPIGILCIVINGQLVAKKLSGTGQFGAPVSVSILSPKGEVISSTVPSLLGQVFVEAGAVVAENGQKPPIYLYPDGNNFKFYLKGQERMGVIADLKANHVFLLVETSANINLVNMPYYLGRLAACFVLILVFGGGGTVWFTYRVSRPLRQLCQVMHRVGEGDLGTRFSKDPMGFELNIVGEYFNDMVTSLLLQIEQVKNEKIQKEMLVKELKIGQDIQNAMLPATLPDVEGLDIATGYLAAREVGGDFYDMLSRENTDECMFAIADTAGKGVFACFYSLMMRSLMRSFLWGELNSLARGITRANNMFLRDSQESGVFVTAWIAYYHRITKVLTYTSCGHFPVYLKRVNGVIEELTTQGIALGVIPFESVEIKQVTLEKGDTLILYTDGVVEAHNKQSELFGVDRLKTLIEQDEGQLAEKLVHTILQAVSRFAEGVPQHDDITVLVIRI